MIGYAILSLYPSRPQLVLGTRPCSSCCKARLRSTRPAIPVGEGGYRRPCSIADVIRIEGSFRHTIVSYVVRTISMQTLYERGSLTAGKKDTILFMLHLSIINRSIGSDMALRINEAESLQRPAGSHRKPHKPLVNKRELHHANESIFCAHEKIFPGPYGTPVRSWPCTGFNTGDHYRLH
jgi:hypothetical protein